MVHLIVKETVWQKFFYDEGFTIWIPIFDRSSDSYKIFYSYQFIHLVRLQVLWYHKRNKTVEIKGSWFMNRYNTGCGIHALRAWKDVSFTYSTVINLADFVTPVLNKYFQLLIIVYWRVKPYFNYDLKFKSWVSSTDDNFPRTRFTWPWKLCFGFIFKKK